jgi:hypothetical protein
MTSEKSVALIISFHLDQKVAAYRKMSILERTMTGFLKNRLVRSCIETVFDLFRPAGRKTSSLGVVDPIDMVE